MTKSQKTLINQSLVLALNARRELGKNAADGASARPTVDQLNSTLTRLSQIINNLESV